MTDRADELAREFLLEQGLTLPDHEPWITNNLAKLLRTYAAEVGRRTAEEWQPMDAAKKDGSRIIYLAYAERTRGGNPYWVGDCIWRDEDEGVPEGWWDDASTLIVEPIRWMPFPDTKGATSA